MKRLLLLVVVAIALQMVSQAMAEHVHSFKVYYNPARTAPSGIVWDCPVFAYYSSEKIIYRQSWERSVEALRIGKLSASDPMLDDWEVIFRRFSGQVYELTNSREPALTIIESSYGNIQIYGDWIAPRKFSSNEVIDPIKLREANNAEEKLFQRLPEEIRNALVRLKEFKCTGANQWRPEVVTVQLQPIIDPIDEKVAIAWPLAWHGEYALTGGVDGMLRVELVASKATDAIQMFKTIQRVPLFRIGSQYRYGQLQICYPSGNELR